MELKWNEKFNIGNAEVDKAHQRLFSVVGRLMSLEKDEKKRKWACAEAVKYFKSYAKDHFEQEEKYMQKVAFGGYRMHKLLHDDMRENTIPALERDLEESDYSPESIQHFMGFCFGWLAGHILIEDRAIMGRIINRWDNEQMRENVDSVAERAAEVVHKMFQLDVKLVSKYYDGKDFGKRLIYRLDYISDEGEESRIFWAVEEQLVLRTVGDMMKTELKKMDIMVTEAAKQLIRQLLKGMAKGFEQEGKYRLVKDHLLDKEQMAKEFLAGYPYYSLLFDTGCGYFAFCVKSQKKKIKEKK